MWFGEYSGQAVSHPQRANLKPQVVGALPLLSPEYACTQGQEVPPWAESQDSVPTTAVLWDLHAEGSAPRVHGIGPQGSPSSPALSLVRKLGFEQLPQEVFNPVLWAGRFGTGRGLAGALHTAPANRILSLLREAGA